MTASQDKHLHYTSLGVLDKKAGIYVQKGSEFEIR